jgi:hypothetical protein
VNAVRCAGAGRGAWLAGLWAVTACGGSALPRGDLPREPIAFIAHKASEGSLSLEALREALRIERPGDEPGEPPRLKTVLSLLVPASGAVQPVPGAQPGDLPLDWSPDGSRLLVGRASAGTRQLELFAWNRATGAWSRAVRERAVSGASLGDGPIRAAWGARLELARGSSSYTVRLATDAEASIELRGARGGVDPDVARDGRALLFARPPGRSGEEGVILLAAGEEEPRALGRGSQPRFSRDGRFIVFTRQRGGSRDVWRMRSDGTGRRAITDSALHDEEYPSLSPDGAYVVYASARGARGESQLFLTRVSDRREIQLTAHGQNTRPVW